MTPFEREEMKRRAQAKLAALRERAARLRRRVLLIAAVGFVALWAAIFVQMVTGHDPALGPATATAPAAAAAAAQESVASDPERRVFVETEATAEAEVAELQAEAEAAETEAAEAEAAEVEELEAATTGQS